MKILDAHLMRRLIFSTAGAMVALLLLFTIIDLLTHRRPDIIDNDVPALTVAYYYLLLIPKVLIDYHVAAISVLVAGLLVFGSASQHNEFTAMLACGVPLRRISRAPLLVAAGLSAGLFLMAETVSPAAARGTRAIEEHFFGLHADGSITQRPGASWSNLDDDWTVHIAKFNRLALTGEDVLMLALREDVHEQIRARRIFWDDEDRRWFLEDGVWSVFYPNRGMAVKVSRISQTTAPIRETPEELFAPFEDSATRNLAELKSVMLNASKKGVPTRRLKVDYYSRFSKPVLPLVIIWLAIPFAVRLRRGGLSVGFGISILLGLSYLVLFGASKSLGYSGHLSPFVAAWLANFIFLAAGVVLVSRTPT